MEISLERAKQNKLFYFVAIGVIFRESDERCLILKRSSKEIAHPGRWGVIGGKLEWKDLQAKPPTRINGDIRDWENEIEELVKREAREEAGVDVDDFRYLGSVVFVRPDGIPVVCPKFGVRYVGGEVTPAPEFEDVAWVNGEEVDQYPCIDGIPDEVRRTIEIFSRK